MAHTLMLVPTNVGVGLTSVVDGLMRAIENQGLRVSLYTPTIQHQVPDNAPEDNMAISIKRLEALLSEGRSDEFLEEMVGAAENLRKNTDILLVEGMIHSNDYPYAAKLNLDIAKALGAGIIFVAASRSQSLDELFNGVQIISRAYEELTQLHIIGCIVNKVNSPAGMSASHQQIDEHQASSHMEDIRNYFKLHNVKLLGCIPWQRELIAPRVKDVSEFLQAEIINASGIEDRRIMHVSLCARTLPNIVGALKPGTLIITAADRVDVILAAAMAVSTGIKMAGLLLTGGYELDPNIMALCEPALKTGLPILLVNKDSFSTATLLQNMPTTTPKEDTVRLEMTRNHVASCIDTEWIRELAKTQVQRLLSPSAFRYQLTEKARALNKVIVLPEGNEPRTLAAASICAEKGIARCILLGDPAEIKRVAEHNAITLHDAIQIINPENVYERYIQPLVQLRKHKGVTELIAREELHDNVVLGTMMLQLGEVDGLVSGAVHTTANTIRPALQIIKTAPNTSLVSSVFFMCLTDHVLVYGDCAVNPDPTAEQLADIAIQSSDSATMFGITPLVAMISYSTGDSGSGMDVNKVKDATAIVKEKRPDILIDGPLQYDAALIKDVAKTKAPNSPVAGKATVFIFPDLNTGNTTYKAVQRSADVLCIGPMLQGLRKPVNDLSRGATIDDIVYTIALTAIQSSAQ